MLATLSRVKPAAKVREYEAHVLVCNCVDCLGLCKHGPNSIVYPSGTWYLGLAESDVPEIVERHLRGGEPIDHLAAEFRSSKKSKK